jgi:predicted secreted hydrolase
MILLAVSAVLFIAPLGAEDSGGTPAAEPWQRAIGPWAWLFPRDHGAHPAFKTEWWYFTGNLNDDGQHRYGYQLTLFRQGIQFTPAQQESRWGTRDFYFGHFTISDRASGRFLVQERVSRGALGEARSAVGKMDVALGPWTIQQGSDETIHLVAAEPEMAIDFQEKPAKPLILEGVGGLSQKDKGVGEASYYYSYPRLATSGQLRIGDQTRAVSGLSWFDHEFSTSSLGPEQVGWDWFCVQLNDEEELMLYAMREKSGMMDPVSEGTWVKRDGTTERLAPGSFAIQKLGTWRSAISGAVYPSGWHITVPSRGADLTITPAMENQELHLTKMGSLNYWEGACSAQGTVAGQAVTGVGYTELTGYAGSLQAGLSGGGK